MLQQMKQWKHVAIHEMYVYEALDQGWSILPALKLPPLDLSRSRPAVWQVERSNLNAGKMDQTWSKVAWVSPCQNYILLGECFI